MISKGIRKSNQIDCFALLQRYMILFVLQYHQRLFYRFFMLFLLLQAQKNENVFECIIYDTFGL